MAIDRGGFRRGRGERAPPKNPFFFFFLCVPKSVTRLPLTSYPGFAPDRYKRVCGLFKFYPISVFFSLLLL